MLQFAFFAVNTLITLCPLVPAVQAIPGDRWVGPFTVPKTDPGEREIFAAALIPTGPKFGHVLYWRRCPSSMIPFPTYVIDVKALPLTGYVDCLTNTPEMRVICVMGSEIGCPGLSFDRDGRVLAAAGHVPKCGMSGGSDTFNIFDPVGVSWIEAYPSPGAIATLNTCRHYPSGLFIPNNSVDYFLAFGGGEGDGTYESYNMSTNQWFQSSTPLDLNHSDYAFAHLVPDGVYLANPWFPNLMAPGTPAPTYYIDATQTFVSGPPRSNVIRRFSPSVIIDRLTGNGNARSQRIILFGGREQPSPPGLTCEDFAATNTIEWIDDPRVAMGGSWSGVQPVLKRARTYCKAVVLPNGKVCILGGADHEYIPAFGFCEEVDLENCSSPDIKFTQEVEIYDPVSNTSTLSASEPVRRAYHSCALLLADGRIFSAGGDITAPGKCDSDKDVTIYEPPYLAFPRPTAVGVSSSTVHRGDTIDISANLPPGATVARVTLTAPGVSTHNIETHERYIELELVPPDPGFVARAKIPHGIWRIPAGYYMLWIVLDYGGISKAIFIKVT